MFTIKNPFIIESDQSASEFLNYFNSFHDGFIKRFSLESGDFFSEGEKGDHLSRSQAVTSEFRLRIDIAHYNYGAGEAPFNRGVCLLFDEFQDFTFGFYSTDQQDWIINEIAFNRISRPLDSDPVYSMKQFEFQWNKPVYDKIQGWTEEKISLFSFSKALAWEEDWEQD